MSLISTRNISREHLNPPGIIKQTCKVGNNELRRRRVVSFRIKVEVSHGICRVGIAIGLSC